MRLFRDLYRLLPAFACLFLACAPQNGSKKPSEAHRLFLIQYRGVNPTTVQSVEHVLTKRFGPWLALTKMEMDLPSTAKVKQKRNRYRADSLLAFPFQALYHIWKTKASPGSGKTFVLGITSADISVSKRNTEGNIKHPVSKYADWGILGLGSSFGSGILSDYRLGKPGTRRFEHRLNVLTLHEGGHMLGLPHCPNLHCLMQDAKESVKTFDQVEPFYCSTCKYKLSRWTKPRV